MLRILVGLGAASLTGCSYVPWSPQNTRLATDRVDLPTSVEPGRAFLFIDARINGAGPFRLLVDTGAPGLVLVPGVMVAAGLHALPHSTVSVTGATGMVGSNEVTTVDRLEMEGLKMTRLKALILSTADADNLKRVLNRFDGIIGMGAWSDVILEMDFPRHQVSAVKRGSGHYPTAAAVPYTSLSPSVVVEVDGKPLAAEVDTGFDGAMSFSLDVLPFRYPRMKTAGGVALGAVEKSGEAGQLAGEVRLGPVSWVRPPASQGINLIGVMALDTWKLAIDQREHKIYFIGNGLRRQWPEQNLRAPAGYSASFEGSRLRLLTITGGGAADRAGLWVGDIIISIDGIPAVDYVTGHAPDALKKIRRRTFVVERDGKQFPALLVLEGAEAAQ